MLRQAFRAPIDSKRPNDVVGPLGTAFASLFDTAAGATNTGPAYTASLRKIISATSAQAGNAP